MEEKSGGWSRLYNFVVLTGIWARLSNKAKAVFPVLHAYLNDKSRQCWPSNIRIAQEAGINVRTVSSATEELLKFGLIKKWRKDRKNFYYISRKPMSLNPSVLVVRINPSRMDVSRQRFKDKRGCFIAKPLEMDVTTPSKLDLDKPSEMDKNKILLSKRFEQEASHGSRTVIKLLNDVTVKKIYAEHGFEGFKQKMRELSIPEKELDALNELEIKAL